MGVSPNGVWRVALWATEVLKALLVCFQFAQPFEPWFTDSGLPERFGVTGAADEMPSAPRSLCVFTPRRAK